MTKIWVVDNEPSTRFPIYTRGNVGEVFPTVVSPLTWTSYGLQAEAGWRAAFRKCGALLPGDFGDDPFGVIGIFGGYAYLNASFLRVFGERTPGLTAADMDRQLIGASDAPPYEAAPGDKNLMASLRMTRTLIKTLRAKSLPELEDDKRAVQAWLSALPALDASDDELLHVLNGFIPLFEQLFERHIYISFLAGIGPALVTQLCTDKLGEPDLPNQLLAGIGSVESAAPSTAMWELSRMTANTPKFETAFAAFLDEYGSRGPNEWEGSSETWGTSPDLALAAIDRMRGADDSHEPARQQSRLEAERVAATARARAGLKGAARLQFSWALRSAHLFSQGRERSKTTIIRANHGLRLRMRELAGRGRERGGPEALADFWLLTRDEVRSYLADPSSMKAALDERRTLRDHLLDLVPPFVFVGTQPPPETWERRSATTTSVAAGDVLVGIAGCPGVAKGRARVVLDPGDPRGLGPGEVLVAPITDPSWTPLFVPAEAVVVDVGAQMSHAVIVSRELGIPAVVSVTGATRRIPDGALIEVDGTKGEVRILEMP